MQNRQFCGTMVKLTALGPSEEAARLNDGNRRNHGHDRGQEPHQALWQNLALDRVSFKIEEGTIVGFLGPNGAGKSTAMNIITGYLSATSGEVTVSGKNTLEEPNEVKKMIGYLPELPPLYMDMTVKEYLNFMYELKKAKLPREKHLKEICQLVKIENVYNRLIRAAAFQVINPRGGTSWA